MAVAEIAIGGVMPVAGKTMITVGPRIAPLQPPHNGKQTRFGGTRGTVRVTQGPMAAVIRGLMASPTTATTLHRLHLKIGRSIRVLVLLRGTTVEEGAFLTPPVGLNPCV